MMNLSSRAWRAAACGLGVSWVLSALCCWVLVALVAAGARAQCGADWQLDMGIVGVDGRVRAMEATITGVYVAGDFLTGGNARGPNVVRYSPLNKQWSSLGGGVAFQVNALAVMTNGDVIAGGELDGQGMLSRWNGTTWSGFGGLIDGSVFALSAQADGTLVVGGAFTHIGGISAARIARLNGSSWQTMGAGFDDSVYALARVAGGVVAGGGFQSSGQISAKAVAQWNGSAWSAIGDGFNNAVAALAVDDDGVVYAGGYFTMSGAEPCPHVAAFKGTWVPLGGGTNAVVQSLLIRRTRVLGGFDVVAGGVFTDAGGVTVNCIAAYRNGWRTLGASGVSDSVRAMAPWGDDFLAGGSFHSAGSLVLGQIGRWNESAGWSALSDGIDGPVYAAAKTPDGYIVAGDFSRIDGVNAARVARWNGIAWEPIGAGFNGAVRAVLYKSDSEIYVGGEFTQSGQAPRSRVARWNGSAWTSMGAGIDGQQPVVNALTMLPDGRLVAGGFFELADGAAAVSLAQWNGSAWSQFGTGITTGNRIVYALSSRANGELIVGGNFGVPTGRNIASWRNGGWFSFGLGTSDQVHALQYVPSDGVFVGGGFNFAGGKFAQGLAGYDFPTNNWIKLGPTLVTPGGIVTSLAYTSEGDIIAGGAATSATPGYPGSVMRYQAGNVYSEVGTDFDGPVYAVLGLDGGKVLACGAFTSHQGGISAGIALWVPPAPPQITGQPAAAKTCGGGVAQFGIEATSNGAAITYRWQIEAEPFSDQWDDLSDGTYPGTVSTIQGSATALLKITNAKAPVAKRVRCKVATSCTQFGYSNPAELKVCSADLNCDGSIDTGEFTTWFGWWNVTDPRANIDGRPGVDLGDFFEFLNSYDQGC